MNARCPLEQAVTWASQWECRRRALLHLGKSPEVWDLASSRASLLGRDSPSQKPSAGESGSDTITPGFFYLFIFVCVCVCGKHACISTRSRKQELSFFSFEDAKQAPRGFHVFRLDT